MNQPFYETSEDVAREAAIAAELSRIWKRPLVKLRKAYPVDWAILDNDTDKRVVAFLEIKDRNKYSMDQLDAWGGVFVSLIKWAQADHLCRLVKLPLVVVIKASGVLWVHVSESGREYDGLHFRGRNDRGDPHDVEPVVLLRKARFHHPGAR